MDSQGRLAIGFPSKLVRMSALSGAIRRKVDRNFDGSRQSAFLHIRQFKPVIVTVKLLQTRASIRQTNTSFTVICRQKPIAIVLYRDSQMAVSPLGASRSNSTRRNSTIHLPNRIAGLETFAPATKSTVKTSPTTARKALPAAMPAVVREACFHRHVAGRPESRNKVRAASTRQKDQPFCRALPPHNEAIECLMMKTPASCLSAGTQIKFRVSAGIG